MRFPGRFIILKILAAAAIGVFVYSGAVTLRTLLFGIDGGFFAVLLFVMIMVLGHLAGVLFWGDAPVLASGPADSGTPGLLSFMLHIKNGSRFVAALIAWSIILLPLLAAFLIYRQYGIWRSIFEMLLAVIVYSMSLKHSRLSFTQIMSNSAVYTGFFILVACLEAPYFKSSLSYLKPWLLAASYFFILAYLIIRNQEDIDSNIFDKKHVEKSILPRNLRRFNTFSVCGVFLIIILFFNLKPVVIYLLQLLGKLTVLIIKAILWIMGHIFPAQEAVQEGGAAAPDFSMFPEEVQLISPFKNLLSNIIKNFVILYLAYRLLLLLIKKLPGLVGKLVKWIGKLLSLKTAEKTFETMDYSDETETVKPVHRHDSQRKLKKKMRKSRRDLKSISDPVEKVRYMYSSILHMIPLIGVRADSWDTTMDILRKAAVSEKVSKELSPFTAIYNQVRYGDKVPGTEMMTEAEGYFNRTVEIIERK